MHFIDKIAWRCASLDTRLLENGNVFFAIKNGHKFVSEAFAKGADFAIISDKKYVNANTILVDNTLDALLQYGDACKMRANAKIIAITGSVGKTTTKTWMQHILSKKCNTFCSIRNYNTIYGIPICLSMLKPAHNFGIFELGTNKIGEMRELSNYLKPDVGVVLNIENAHIGNFYSMENLIKEKMSIQTGISSNGWMVINGDMKYEKNFCKNIITFGENHSNDVVIDDFAKYFIHLERHYMMLCCAIIAVIIVLGMDYSEFLPYFSELVPIAGRGQITKCFYNGVKFTLIDDAYNACPTSMKAALKYLKNIADGGRSVAIIGEMLELGDDSLKYHEKIAQLAEDISIDNKIFVGSQKLQKLFVKHGFDIKSSADISILSNIHENDTVLIKGSHGTNLWQLVDMIK